MSHADIVELLLKYGADVGIVSDDGYTALSLAQEEDNPQIIQLLHNHGAK